MIEINSNPISNVLIGNQQVRRVYLGSNIVWENQNSIVYTPLEYISSDSNGQYLNLGVKLYTTLTPDFDFEIKFKYKGVGIDNDNQATIFNSQLSSTSPWPGVFVRRNSSNIQARRGNNTTVNIGTPNNIITYSYDESLGYNNQNLTHNINASLFCVLDANDNPGRRSICDLYYFKLWQGGVLTMDLVPVKNNNNVVGMYNTINGVLYTSPNGVPFIAGPEIPD